MLAGTGVPVIGAGCGAGNDDAFIAACYETGIRLFDTDARYRGGRHEEMLGRTFQRLGVRRDVIIVTKLHPPEHRRGRTPAETLEQIQRECEKSLRRLRTDYIDVLMIQDVSSPGPIHDHATREALALLKQAGKARFAGIATHERMATAVEAATEAGDYDVILTSLNFTMADDTRLLRAITAAAQQGIGILAMKSQAGSRTSETKASQSLRPLLSSSTPKNG